MCPSTSIPFEVVLSTLTQYIPFTLATDSEDHVLCDGDEGVSITWPSMESSLIRESMWRDTHIMIQPFLVRVGVSDLHSAEVHGYLH